jgi:DNA-binding transcriptional MerR regulator
MRMNKKRLVSIGELAKLSRITRATLIHYDKIGVLKPVYIGENNYRYYSLEQISWVNLIRTMQTIGMSLKDIIKITKRRTPEIVLDLFSEQINNINKTITEHLEARKLLLTLQTTIENSIAVNEDKVELVWEKASSIFIGPQNHYDGNNTDWDTLLDFYTYCEEKYKHINLNYSAWAYFSEERIKKGDWKYPDRYYFNSPDGDDKKPEGWYVVGYGRGGYGQTSEIYKKIIAYINENNLEICGPSYEEYPLNEISIDKPENYLIRISLTVREK